MTATAAPVPGRAPWRRLAFTLAAFILFPFFPQVRAALPIEQTGLMLVAIVAVFSIVGWVKGGRAGFAVIWIAMTAVLMIGSVTPANSSYTWMARGWILLLAASFGIVSLVVANEAFFVRALSALAISFALAFGIILVSPGGMDRASSAVSAELNRRVGESNAALRQGMAQPEWKQLFDRRALHDLSANTEAQLADILRLAQMTSPALLALESLAALALGWSLYHRMNGAPLGPPLGRLVDFKFNDQLVWGVAVGASIFLLKAFADGRNAGLNLLLFFGFLYVLRGAGIISWMARGRGLRVMLLIAAVLAWPVMGALAFGIGLGDTWLDWRSRMQSKPV